MHCCPPCCHTVSETDVVVTDTQKTFTGGVLWQRSRGRRPQPSRDGERLANTREKKIAFVCQRQATVLFVSQEANTILTDAGADDVAFLVVGDPFG